MWFYAGIQGLNSAHKQWIIGWFKMNIIYIYRDENQYDYVYGYVYSAIFIVMLYVCVEGNKQ